MPRRDQRFQNLLDGLRRQIGDTYAPGEQLPTGRELAAMHAVGLTTIQRAMKALSVEGCVKTLSRVGWQRAAGKKSARKGRVRKLAVGVMSRRSAEEWPNQEIYQALSDEARRRDIALIPIPNPHVHRTTIKRNRIELNRVAWNSFDVGLLVEAEDTIRLRDPILRERRVLAVDQDATGYGIDSVSYANHEAGEMAAQHLLELGHTRFAVSDEMNDVGFPLDPAWTARRHGFEAAIGEAGGLLLPQWRLPVPRRSKPVWDGSGFHRGSHYHLVKTTVAAWAAAPPGQKPTALFVLTPSTLVQGRLIEELHRAGMRVPRDFSVIAVSVDGKFGSGIEPVVDGLRFTCIDFNLPGLVRRTFDAAQELATEKRSAREKRRAPKLYVAPAMLRQGQTTAPPP